MWQTGELYDWLNFHEELKIGSAVLRNDANKTDKCRVQHNLIGRGDETTHVLFEQVSFVAHYIGLLSNLRHQSYSLVTTLLS